MRVLLHDQEKRKEKERREEKRKGEWWYEEVMKKKGRGNVLIEDSSFPPSLLPDRKKMLEIMLLPQSLVDKVTSHYITSHYVKSHRTIWHDMTWHGITSHHITSVTRSSLTHGPPNNTRHLLSSDTVSGHHDVQPHRISNCDLQIAIATLIMIGMR